MLPSESIQTYSAMTIPLWSRSVYLLTISDRETDDSVVACAQNVLVSLLRWCDGEQFLCDHTMAAVLLMRLWVSEGVWGEREDDGGARQ